MHNIFNMLCIRRDIIFNILCIRSRLPAELRIVWRHYALAFCVAHRPEHLIHMAPHREITYGWHIYATLPSDAARPYLIPRCFCALHAVVGDKVTRWSA
eukprot:SAG11_NODE_716_length_7614_cov_63.924837_7_plen_99_part_00